ncbi:MAG: transposase [Patescibacteria group bacterium]
MRKKKRGRDRKRLWPETLVKYFNGDFVSLAREAKRRRLHESSLRRRLRQTATQLVTHPRWPTPRPGPIIVLADAIVKRIRGRWYSGYFVAMKGVTETTATLLPPVILPDRESHRGWQRVLNSIPDQLWRKVVATVSDGHRGIVDYAHATKVKVQRCQAHLLMAIEGRRSTSQWSRHRPEGQQLRTLAKIIFQTQEATELVRTLATVEELGWQTKSVQLKKIISGFLSAVGEYRTCLNYPELNIPATNNALESFISQWQELAHRAHGFASVSAWQIWLTAFAKTKKKITCNGFHPQN